MSDPVKAEPPISNLRHLDLSGLPEGIESDPPRRAEIPPPQKKSLATHPQLR